MSGTLQAFDNANTSPQSISLSGVGTFFKLTPSSLDFGTVMEGMTSPLQTATLTSVAVNSQTYSYQVTGAARNFAVTDLCGGVIPATGSRPFSITFSPQSGGTSSATLKVQGSGPAVLETSLTGYGTE